MSQRFMNDDYFKLVSSYITEARGLLKNDKDDQKVPYNAPSDLEYTFKEWKLIFTYEKNEDLLDQCKSLSVPIV